jgi:hypothetical protein
VLKPTVTVEAVGFLVLPLNELVESFRIKNSYTRCKLIKGVKEHNGTAK